ncbi:hypothetical protein ACVIDN_001350 [Rhizobium brockwellii]
MSRLLIGSMVLAFIADMVMNILLWLGGLETVVSVSSGAMEVFARIMGEVLVFWSLLSRLALCSSGRVESLRFPC